MPRDLFAEKSRIVDDMPVLEKTEKSTAQSPPQAPAADSAPLQKRCSKDKIERDMDKQDVWAEIKPYTKSLTPSDVDGCVKLEDATFPPHERATREKFTYRLTRCGELCLGLFTSVHPDAVDHENVPTASVAQPVSTVDPERKSMLLAHCVATKSANDVVLDADMDVPSGWEHSSKFNSVGHNDAGRTICIHSLAVLPSYQDKGLGSTLIKAYIQRIEQSQAADRIALLAHGELVKFYEMFGFKNKGPSKAQFGGGNWVDMVYEISSSEENKSYRPSPNTADGPVSQSPPISGHIHPPRTNHSHER